MSFLQQGWKYIFSTKNFYFTTEYTNGFSASRAEGINSAFMLLSSAVLALSSAQKNIVGKYKLSLLLFFKIKTGFRN